MIWNPDRVARPLLARFVVDSIDVSSAGALHVAVILMLLRTFQGMRSQFLCRTNLANNDVAADLASWRPRFRSRWQ
jgi:hypothetical protein